MLIRALAPTASASSSPRRRGRLPDPAGPPCPHDEPGPAAPTCRLVSVTARGSPGGRSGEAFLRALVVEMSRTVEAHHGPDAAEAVIAQVGTDVGGQMEAEFRVATEVVGRMTPDQLGECHVRPLHAIDGQFSVVEATPERIVLRTVGARSARRSATHPRSAG